jgi:hypothetical protein
MASNQCSVPAKCFLCGLKHQRKNFAKCTSSRGVDFFVTVCENCFHKTDLKELMEQKHSELLSEVSHA